MNSDLRNSVAQVILNVCRVDAKIYTRCSILLRGMPAPPDVPARVRKMQRESGRCNGAAIDLTLPQVY